MNLRDEDLFFDRTFVTSGVTSPGLWFYFCVFLLLFPVLLLLSPFVLETNWLTSKTNPISVLFKVRFLRLPLCQNVCLPAASSVNDSLVCLCVSIGLLLVDFRSLWIVLFVNLGL